MKTLAGFSVPAGVIIIGIMLGMLLAASMTAIKPARFACELNASIFWLRVVRGIISLLTAVTL